MLPILQVAKHSRLCSESGTGQFLYLLDFQSLSAFRSVSQISSIERNDQTFKKLDVEPIGQQTSIPHKPKVWEPSRLWSEWDDETDENCKPESPVNVPTGDPSEDEFDSFIKSLEEQGYVNKGGMFKRTVETDTSPLAAYGYYLAKEDCVLSWGSPKENPTQLVSAYNINGDYIGDAETAKFLCEEKGIMPELASGDNKVCSIGKSRFDGKWYGWSHRAINGFGEGTEVNRESCGFKPNTMEDACQKTKDWYSDIMEYKDVEVKPVDETEDTFKVFIKFPTPGEGKVVPVDRYETIPKGNGAFIVSGDEQAKQAAIDFAESVSTAQVSADQTSLLSESAKKDFSLLNYAWYKFNGARSKHFKKHNRSYDLEVEPGLVIGIRYSPRAKSVYLALADELPGQEWKLSEREAQNLIKQCKGFGGKRDGIKLTRGNGDIKQIDKPSNQVVTPGRPVKKGEEQVEKEIQKKTVRTNNKKRSVTLLGFFVPSAHQPERVAVVEGETVAEVKKNLNNFMENQKNIGSTAKIIRYYTEDVIDIVQRLNGKKITYIKGAIFNKFSTMGRMLEKDYKPAKLVVYDESIEVPRYDDTDWKPNEPVFPGNEKAAMEELQEAIIRDKKFTAIFAHDTKKLKGNRVRKSPKGFYYLVFNTDTVNKKFINEAKDFVVRIQRIYGKAIKGRVDVLGQKPGEVPKISVVIFMTLKTVPKEQQERSLKLLEVKRNLDTRERNKGQIARLVEEIRSKGISPADKTRKEKELAKLSNESINAKALTFGAPLYAIKSGSVFLPAEVIGIDVPKGTIQIRMVRDRKFGEPKSVKQLHSLDGSKTLL